VEERKEVKAVENSLGTVHVVVLAFGAIIGSFLNVCIVRIPRGESLIRPPSRCLECGTQIRFYDNVPLLSYLLLRGRCRSCGERISQRYFWVELTTAIAALALYGLYGFTVAFFVYFVFVAALLAIAFIDLAERIVPDVISLPGTALGFLFSLLSLASKGDPGLPSPLSSLAGILLGGGLLLLVAWGYYAITGSEGMGGGDVKLLAMIGAFLGWPAIPVTLFFAALSGSAVGLYLMIAKGVGGKYAMPFAPFLCAGAVAYLFLGERFMAFYVPA
jgi:leader peptidase (prepilin peptidase)/N-methyltransferase